jgi:hypothetical protein
MPGTYKGVRTLIGFSTRGDLADRVRDFARENDLTMAAAVRMLTKKGLDVYDEGRNSDTPRQRKSPRG